MPALTRAEAQTRAQLLDVRHYAVDLDLDQGEDQFASTTVIRFAARRAADTFAEVKPAELHRAVLDGQELDPATLDGNRLPLTLTEGEHELRVEAAMAYSRTGEGLHRFTDPADGETYTYTQLFMEDVQRVFAAFDQPDLKATFALTVAAPPAWTVLGNGVATPTGEAGRWTLATTPPISTYLVAIAAGPWHSVRTEHAGLPFAVHSRRSLAAHLDRDAEEILDVTRRCFDRYAEKFDEPYPFDSYDQAFVPEFNAGAMENPGLVTFRDEFVYRSAVTETERQTRAMVVAHEMAHMWFGDLVTLRWWDDIWLNESFAEYMGYQTLTECTRFTDTWTDFGITRKRWGYEADQRPSTHPVAPEAVPDTASALLNFDGISYAKGASALRQLVAWLGEKDFLAGINDHFARHRFGNATLADFIDSMARASGRDVPAWADAWLRTTGVDTLVPQVTEDDGGWRLTVVHRGSRPHRIAVGLYDRGAGAPLVPRERRDLELPATGDGAVLGGDGPRPDLVLLNDGDLTFAKIRLDDRSWTTVRSSLTALPDALARTVVWNAARDMVRDAELRPAAFLETVCAHLPRETDLALVQGVLGFTRGEVAERLLPAADRAAALDALAALCRDLLRDPDGDPGLRLTAVRTLIDSATTPDELRDWLATGTHPGGPALDPELRWRALLRLSVLGAATPEKIEAELAADPSATGQEGAARCRAALPDPRAKQAAWDAMYGDDDLSTYLFTATAQGFWQPEQADLVRAYVPRYFTDAVALSARRGPAIAASAGRYAFPLPFVDEETLRLGEACLADGDPIPSLRRRLEDQVDDLRRALRVREAAG